MLRINIKNIKWFFCKGVFLYDTLKNKLKHLVENVKEVRFFPSEGYELLYISIFDV